MKIMGLKFDEAAQESMASRVHKRHKFTAVCRGGWGGMPLEIWTGNSWITADGRFGYRGVGVAAHLADRQALPEMAAYVSVDGTFATVYLLIYDERRPVDAVVVGGFDAEP